MRIDGWHVDGFGLLVDAAVRRLPPGLTVVSGPNEAGKSTLLAFVRGVLFGFADASDGSRPYPPLRGGRHGGRLTVLDDDGGAWVVERMVEPPRLTVRRPDGRRGTADDLRDLLGGADAALFANVFAFSLDELDSFDVIGADAVRERVLSASITGAGRSAREALRELRARRAALVDEHRGRLPAAVASARDAQVQLVRALEGSRAVAALAADLPAMAQAVLDARTATDEARTALVRLDTLLDAWPSWVRLRELELRLRDLDQHPVAEESAPAELARLESELAATEAAIERARARVDGAEGIATAASAALMAAEAETATAGRRRRAARAEVERLRAAVLADDDAPTAAGPPAPPDRRDPSDGSAPAVGAGAGAAVVTGAVGAVALAAGTAVAALAGGGAAAVGLGAVAALVGAGTWGAARTRRRAAAAHRAEEVAAAARAERAEQLARAEAAEGAAIDELTAAEQVVAARRAELEAERAESALAGAEELATAERRRAELAASRGRLLADAGVADDRALADAAARGRERRDLVAEQRAADAALRALVGAGAGADDLLARLASGDRTTWRGEAEAARRRIDDLAATHEELIRRHHDAHRQVEEQTASTAVADAALGLEAARARVRSRAEAALDLEAAEALVTAALAHHERERRPAVVARAEQLFARVTGGRYRRLLVRDAELALVDIEGRTLSATDLSRGTVELLYLCVRFALAAELAATSALPLVMDDVLVNFDPERMHALAGVISELADDHQVILFTCQPATVRVLRAARPDLRRIDLPRYGGD